jgi:DNA-directed RNA polymerase specialized sigma24 family protein
MGQDDAFDALMRRLRAGDEDASALVFRQFVGKLVALAGRQFRTEWRDRADVEGVVQSVYRSFFARQARGEFELADWDALWGLLAVIALRKCEKRRDYLLAAVRDSRREVVAPLEDGSSWAWEPIDREPTPPEAVALTDTVDGLLRDLEGTDREIACRFLQGYTAEEIARELGSSERTARRMRWRLKHRLRRLLDEGGEGP